MGGLRKRMPVTFWVYLTGALALAGIAPLAGFFSKDEILVTANEKFVGVFILLIIAAFFTAFYMGRQVFLVFFGKPRSNAADQAVESKPIVTTPLIILAVLSVLGGTLNLPGVHSLGHWLEHSLAQVEEAHFVWLIALLSLAVALLGIAGAWLLYGRKPQVKAEKPDPLAAPLGVVYRGMERKWWVDEFYRAVLLRPANWMAEKLANPVDLGVINAAGDGLARLVSGLAAWLRRFQNGFVRSYALVVLLGVVVILTYLVLR